MKVINIDMSNGCEHCWHVFRGPIHMVIPDGHTVQECCKCHGHRTVHMDHVYGHDQMPDLGPWPNRRGGNSSMTWSVLR